MHIFGGVGQLGGGRWDGSDEEQPITIENEHARLFSRVVEWW